MWVRRRVTDTDEHTMVPSQLIIVVLDTPEVLNFVLVRPGNVFFYRLTTVPDTIIIYHYPYLTAHPETLCVSPYSVGHRTSRH